MTRVSQMADWTTEACSIPVCRLSDQDYSDDDDTSWKVRRAAAKAIAAVITSFPDLLNANYPKVRPVTDTGWMT